MIVEQLVIMRHETLKHQTREPTVPKNVVKVEILLKTMTMPLLKPGLCNSDSNLFLNNLSQPLSHHPYNYFVNDQAHL